MHRFNSERAASEFSDFRNSWARPNLARAQSGWSRTQAAQKVRGSRQSPFRIAKQVASLDLYSGGRFLFGVGGGWNRPEIENHGADFTTRFALMRERIEAMKLLWTAVQL